LPTIRSRCTRLDIGLPPVEQAAQWLAGQGVDDAVNLLALSGGTPLDAQRWADGGELDERRAVLQGLAHPDQIDPVTLGERWKAVSPQTWHNWRTSGWGSAGGQVAGQCAVQPRFCEVLARLGDGRSGEAAGARQNANRRDSGPPARRALQLEAWLIQYRHVFD
jgi:DNA polymerase-3 subunit delta'